MKLITLYNNERHADGCASVGTPVAAQNIPKIQKGVTTEAD